jgi:hypothetical protein
MEWQSDQLIADTLGHRAITRLTAESPAHIREMQRQVVEHAVDAALPKVCDQSLPQS